MDTVQIIKRAWQMLWRYRALWIWGIVLALTTSSWSAWTLANLGDLRERDWEGFSVTRLDDETFGQALRRTLRTETDRANRELSALLNEELHLKTRVNVVALFLTLISLVVVLRILGRIAEYVSQVALIRSVDLYQETGERRSVGRGLRLGWSSSAWRLFVINLVVGLVGIGAAMLLFGLIFAPLPLWVEGGEPVIFLFAFLTAALFFVALVAVILWGVALHALKRLAWRACALDGLRVLPAIGRAYTLLTTHLKQVGGTWLVTAAVRWGWGAVIVPVVLALVGLGLLAGSMPGLLVGGATSVFSSGDLPVFAALAVGIPLFLLVLVAPLIVLAGLREVFVSATWTLSYRQLRALGSRVSQPVPATDAPGLDAAAPALP